MNVQTGSNDGVAYEDRAFEESYEVTANEVAVNERAAIEDSSNISASNDTSALTVVLGDRSNGGSSKEKVIKLII